MAVEARREIWCGGCKLIYPDREISWETEVTIIDDWRDTPLGPVNFVWVHLGPEREIVTMTAPDRN